MSAETVSETQRKGAARRSRGGALWPPPKGAWLAFAGVALLYAGHWFYGALLGDTAMLMGIAAAGLLAAALAVPSTRADLLRLRGLEWPAIFFAATILVALWTLTPWTPGGPHPVWAYVGVSPGASTIDRSATLMEIIKLLGLGCVFLVGAATGARDERARYAVTLTLAAGVAFGLWAFIGAVTGTVTQFQGRRLEGHFLNPNTAGTVFAVLTLLAAAELVRQIRQRRTGRQRDVSSAIAYGGAALTFLVCLLATASRGATFALLAGLVVFLAVQIACGSVKLSRALLAVLGGLVLLMGVVGFAGDLLVERFFRFDQDADIRTEIWRLHWGAFLDSPLFGYGLGTAETVNKTLITASTYPVLANIRAILNVYLQWLEEAGLVGSAPMFLCIAALLVLTVRNTLRRTRMVRLLAALIAVDAVFLVHGATDFGLEVPSVAALWAWTLGLQFSLAQGRSAR